MVVVMDHTCQHTHHYTLPILEESTMVLMVTHFYQQGIKFVVNWFMVAALSMTLLSSSCTRQKKECYVWLQDSGQDPKSSRVVHFWHIHVLLQGQQRQAYMMKKQVHKETIGHVVYYIHPSFSNKAAVSYLVLFSSSLGFRTKQVLSIIISSLFLIGKQLARSTSS